MYQQTFQLVTRVDGSFQEKRGEERNDGSELVLDLDPEGRRRRTIPPSIR